MPLLWGLIVRMGVLLLLLMMAVVLVLIIVMVGGALGISRGRDSRGAPRKAAGTIKDVRRRAGRGGGAHVNAVRCESIRSRRGR